MKTVKERDHFEDLEADVRVMDVKVMDLEYMNYIRGGLL
jgi:hypothetical protein